MVRQMKNEGYRIKLSYSAGTFVCNDLFYRVSHACAGTNVKVGFIHVPFLPEQAAEGVPFMELSEIIRTLQRCCEIAEKEI